MESLRKPFSGSPRAILLQECVEKMLKAIPDTHKDKEWIIDKLIEQANRSRLTHIALMKDRWHDIEVILASISMDAGHPWIDELVHIFEEYVDQ